MAACDGAGEPRLRPFDPEDLPDLQRIRRAAFAPAFRSFRKIVGAEIGRAAFARADEEQARQLEDLCSRVSPHVVLVVEVGDAVVGFAAFSADADTGTGEIGLNAVHPDHAGRGIGTWMYAQVLERMRAMGMTVATVSTGSDPSHAPARRAYEKAGFGASIPSLSLFRRL